MPGPLPMPSVWIPPLMRSLSGGRENLDIPGTTIREVLDNLEAECPGIRARLFDGDRVRPGIAIAVDGIIKTKKLGSEVAPGSEIHFVPAISGGRPGLFRVRFRSSTRHPLV